MINDENIPESDQDNDNYLTIFFHNVRSFKRSKSDVMENLIRHDVDLAILIETFNPFELEPPT